MTLPEPAPEYIVLRDFLRKEPDATPLQIFLAGWDGAESAGFQARSHLVELLKKVRHLVEASYCAHGSTYDANAMALIDAALKREK